MYNNSERMPNITIIPIGTLGATASVPGMYFRKKSRIKHVHYIDQAGIAADNTNFLQVVLEDLAGVDYYTLDTRAANQGAVTALTPKELIQATATNPQVGDATNDPEGEVAAGTSLKVTCTKNGTGVPTLGALQVEWYPL
jgi:hypothetical protein